MDEEALTSRRQERLMEAILKQLSRPLVLNPKTSLYLQFLTSILDSRQKTHNNHAEIKADVEIERQLVQITSGFPSPTPSKYLNRLGEQLMRLYRHTARSEHLDEAVEVSESAVLLVSQSSPEYAIMTNSYLVRLMPKLKAMQNAADLDEPLKLARKSLDATRRHYPFLSSVGLNTLAGVLQVRYQLGNEKGDLDEAITITREALATLDGVTNSIPITHERALSLNNLGNRLQNLYRRTGDLRDLEEAIWCARRSLKMTEPSSKFRPSRLNNIGRKLMVLYERRGVANNLDEAVEYLTEAVHAPSYLSRENRPGFLNNLALSLALKFDRSQNVEDLNWAIIWQKEAIKSLFDNDHMDHPRYVNNLGGLVLKLYMFQGEKSVLKDAIQILQSGVELGRKSENKILQGQRLVSLASGYLKQFWEGIVDSTDAAHTAIQEAFKMIPEKDPNHATVLIAKGRISEATGQVDDALNDFVKASKAVEAEPLMRVIAARSAIRILQEKSKWADAVPLAKEALSLLHLLCGRHLNLKDQEHAITQTSGLAADTCTVFIESGDTDMAFQQLERGRGLILRYLVDQKMLMGNEAAQELHQEYETLLAELSEGPTPDTPFRDHREVTQDVETCLEKIQGLNREWSFTEMAAEELKEAGKSGPIIVVNCTNIMSHAIINWSGKITAFRLPKMSPETAPAPVKDQFRRYQDRSREEASRDIGAASFFQYRPDQLEWLWATCVEDILEKLGELGMSLDGTQRVWWIGTGIAGAFPFHAARSRQNPERDDTMRRIISSYTPTIRILKYSRMRASKRAILIGSKTTEFSFVAMPTTPEGQKSLAGVGDELTAVRKTFNEDSCSFNYLEHPTANQVLAQIETSDMVHFACHGFSDPKDPAESHLLLQKEVEGIKTVDPLTLLQISSGQSQKRSWLTYLSACSTAEVKFGSLADESLHLSSIFQAAGFVHVIGSMRSVDDTICAKLAEIFYAKLAMQKPGAVELSNDEVALALNQTVLEVRKSEDDESLEWVPFVHFGA